MSTLQQRLSDLTTRIATECKSIRTLINGNATDNSALITTAKTNLVAAINEVKAQANSLAASGGATINDSSTSSSTQTYSVDKILSEIAATATAVKNEILGGAGSAYDTLQELKDLLDGEAAEVSNLTNLIGTKVSTTEDMGLSSSAKAIARANIDAYGSTELGNPDTNFVNTFESGLL